MHKWEAVGGRASGAGRCYTVICCVQGLLFLINAVFRFLSGTVRHLSFPWKEGQYLSDLLGVHGADVYEVPYYINGWLLTIPSIHKPCMADKEENA